MGESDIITHLLGPNGGTFALGIAVGIVLTWMAHARVLNPQVQRAHTAELAAMQARLDAMELRLKELEKFEEKYMALVEGHSAKTLQPHRS